MNQLIGVLDRSGAWAMLVVPWVYRREAAPSHHRQSCGGLNDLLFEHSSCVSSAAMALWRGGLGRRLHRHEQYSDRGARVVVRLSLWGVGHL